jgi:hypothetical protein
MAGLWKNARSPRLDSPEDCIRACYLHASLRYVQRDFMTNTTLMRPYDESASRKFKRHLADLDRTALLGLIHDLYAAAIK